MTNFNDEMIINDEIEMENNHIVADDGEGIGTGLAMAIGAGLALAVGAGINLGKKGVAKLKAYREKKKAEKAVPVENVDAAQTEEAK